MNNGHRFPHPQQPPSANPIPHIPIHQMTTVPTYAHGCNLSNHIDTRELVEVFRNDATRQPDDPTPFSKIRDLFRNNPRSEISRGVSRSKDVMNLGWMGYGEQPDRRPSKFEIKTS